EDPLFDVTYSRDGLEATIIPKYPGKFTLTAEHYKSVISSSGGDSRVLAHKKVDVTPVRPTSYRFEKDEYVFHIDDECPVITIIPEPANASSERFYFNMGNSGYYADRLVGPFSVKLNLTDICDTFFGTWIEAEDGSQEMVKNVPVRIVNSKAESVEITPQYKEMDDGSEQTLSVSYEPHQAYIPGFKWEITNNSKDKPKAELIETDEAGKIILKALRPGDVVVKVSPVDAPNVFTTQKITIHPVHIESIKIVAEEDHFKKRDGNILLKYTTVPENATVYNVTASVEHEDIAQVVATENRVRAVSEGEESSADAGRYIEIKPKSIGETVVHLTVEGTSVKYAVKPITIDLDYPMENVTLSHEELILNGGTPESVSILSVEPEDADTELISWRVDKEGMLAIEKSDDNMTLTVRGLQPGICNLVMVADGGHGITKEIPVVINDVPVEEILLDTSAISLARYSRPKKITATTVPQNALVSELVWMSTNQNIFTVTAVDSKSANIQAKNTGIARLIVFDRKNNAIKEEMTVSVGESDPFTKLEFEQTQLTVTLNEEPFRLGMIYSPEDAQFDRLIWSSSKQEVADVDEEGEIT
ncbi:MAG: hypothetical protein K2L89_09190, partial [Muribaculaceae bacterium]|nr:hypothetical protein [Muribaculaceae bacterium]